MGAAERCARRAVDRDGGVAGRRLRRRLVGRLGRAGAERGLVGRDAGLGAGRRARAEGGALGLVALWTAWLALANAKTTGINFILSVFCLVWAADIAAYFGGRTFGKRKLAPAISPGKSWEGVWSGMAGVLVLAAAWLALDRAYAVDSASIYTRLQERHGLVGLAIVAVFLAAMSVVGDLVESLVKRAAGAKDSSALLPGHGGVLDRIDALLPVFPLAMAMSSI